MDEKSDLYEHLDAALRENNGAYECHDQRESYLSPVFIFVWIAKAHPAMTDLDAESAAQIVDEYLMTYGHATAEDGWQEEFLEGADYDARALFLQTWDEIRLLVGESWLEAAWRRAVQNCTFDAARELPECKNSIRYAKFLSLAAELQGMRGENTIFLPCREVGETLSVNKETVVAYRRLAEKQGFLQQVKQHHFVEKRGEATEFKFDLARFTARLAALPS